MPKTEIPDKLKREKPDPKAFKRFQSFAKKIVQVSKNEGEESSKDDSHSTDASLEHG